MAENPWYDVIEEDERLESVLREEKKEITFGTHPIVIPH